MAVGSSLDIIRLALWICPNNLKLTRAVEEDLQPVYGGSMAGLELIRGIVGGTMTTHNEKSVNQHSGLDKATGWGYLLLLLVWATTRIIILYESTVLSKMVWCCRQVTMSSQVSNQSEFQDTSKSTLNLLFKRITKGLVDIQLALMLYSTVES